MNMIDLLKERGQSLIIRGPQGCGKSTLALALIGSHNTYVLGMDALLHSTYRPWLEGCQVAIVEDWTPSYNTEEAARFKALAEEDLITMERKGKDPIMVTTPVFILCTSNAEPLPPAYEDRRFMVIDMDPQL